jgi:hypothetical protein
MANMGFIQNELDMKLLVLYIMSHTAEPITFFQLLEIAMCDAGVDYFSLTQAVTHMVETGQLEHANDRYSITEKGRRNSEICESSLLCLILNKKSGDRRVLGVSLTRLCYGDVSGVCLHKVAEILNCNKYFFIHYHCYKFLSGVFFLLFNYLSHK